MKYDLVQQQKFLKEFWMNKSKVDAARRLANLAKADLLHKNWYLLPRRLKNWKLFY